MATRAISVRKDEGLPTVDRERAGGHIKYLCVDAVAGDAVQVDVLVNGAKVESLGPWVASVKPGRKAVVQVRMVVDDNHPLDALEASPEEKLIHG